MTDKATLRQDARRRRRAIMGTDRAAQAVAGHVAALGVQAHETVALYAAQGSELDPAPLAEALRIAGVTVALPHAERADARLTFRTWATRDVLSPDAAGCLTCLDGVPVVPDIVMVPLLAFDRFGGRLGQGGGYYDRTLEALRAGHPALRAIGLAYAAQEVPRVPMDTHDQRLDGVLTELGYRETQRISH